MEYDESTFYQQRFVIIRKNTGQTAPAFRRIAQAKALGNFARQTTPFEVLHGTGRVFEVLFICVSRFFEHIAQGGLFFTLFGGPDAVLGAGIVFGDLHAVLLGQIFHRLHEGHAGMVHQKSNRVPILATTKAVVKLFRRAN